MHETVENVKPNDSAPTLETTKTGDKHSTEKHVSPVPAAPSTQQSKTDDTKADEDVEMEDMEKNDAMTGKNGEKSFKNSNTNGETITAMNGHGESTIADEGTGERMDLEENDAAKEATNAIEKDGEVEEKQTKKEKETNGEDKKTTSTGASPPPPVMKGTLSCDIDQRRHLIRGMWNYENSTVFPPQPFELLRDLAPDEDKDVLPKNGVFHGSFRLAYVHTTSKGKQKERLKSIQETGVDIKFTEVDGKKGEYVVDGKGTNQFGIFHVNGSATRSELEGDNSLNVILRKRYETAEQPAAAPAGAVAPISIAAKTVRTSALNDTDAGPLPPPAQSFPSGVVCLRGKVNQEFSAELGMEDVTQRINGMWASGLDLILADPQNVRGLCNRFEYEHKSSTGPNSFPVSGRYSGWFDLSNEDGNRTRINERDVTLKFRKNSEGYHNVEGRGSNVFGKYSITGTLTLDKVITIFRHFQPRKLKASKNSSSAPQPNAVSSSSATKRPPPTISMPDAKLKIEDVKLPDVEKPDAISPPANGAYSAVSRGVLRVNNDGSHSCQGKWAEMRDHFNNGHTSNFTFRLEPHFATEALAENKEKNPDSREFPLDSAMYRGSFQLKKGSRSSTIVDHQIVMKFQLNNQGSFNVHGKGLNGIGEFNLIGTMIMSGKTGGQVELYRMYPPKGPEAPSKEGGAKEETVPSPAPAPAPTLPATEAAAAPSSAPLMPPRTAMQRRESTRLVKLPSRLEDDDPSAQLSRTMEKCAQILRIVRERDVELGAFFSEPVDPVALGIPTYHQVIKEPMDLRTVSRKMETSQIETPEDFARYVRLVFENAITFNIDPAHSVHQAARNLLTLFNQKYRDVERSVQILRRTHGNDWDGKRKKDDKKRKRQDDELISMKRRRLDEAQSMSAGNASAVAALVAAAPTGGASNVTRNEFNLLLQMIQQLQQQVVQTHTALAELCPGDESDAKVPGVVPSASSVSISGPTSTSTAPVSEPKKKPPRKKAEPPPQESVYDDAPLSLDEQELLTETINELPQEHLGGVIQILREAAPVGADEEEIDLDIDQLDTKTQRKLLAHVSKFVKKPKTKVRKKAASKAAAPAPAPKRNKAAEAAPQKSKASVASGGADPFFAFNKDESESEDDNDNKEDNNQNSNVSESKENSEDFELNDTQEEDENDDDDDLGNSSLAANWNMKTATSGNVIAKVSDEDDAWGAAREQAAVTKAREAERKAREEKLQKEAEELKNQRLADAAAQVEEIRAQREEEEAKNARLREQQEKEAEEARQAARDALRAQVQSVEQTVDLGDTQRDMMKEYEQNFIDKDYGGASPSSDFGF